METRDFPLEIKKLGESGEFEGMAAVYGSVDRGYDVIAAGAFAEDLSKNGNTRPLLWVHDQGLPIGKGTFAETEAGLSVKGKLILTVRQAAEAYDLMKADVIRGLSVGYRVAAGGFEILDSGVRRLTKLSLFETSLCAVPMHPAAQVLRVKGSIASIRDYETFLHRSGWSKREATALASKGWSALSTADDGAEVVDELGQWLASRN